MPLTPNADGTLFFIGQLQARNVVIALQLVPKPNLLVVNVLFHDVILQIRLIPAIQSFWLITKAQREATSLRSASLRTDFSVIFAFGELYCFAVIFGLRRVVLRFAQFGSAPRQLRHASPTVSREKSVRVSDGVSVPLQRFARVLFRLTPSS